MTTAGTLTLGFETFASIDLASLRTNTVTPNIFLSTTVGFLINSLVYVTDFVRFTSASVSNPGSQIKLIACKLPF